MKQYHQKKADYFTRAFNRSKPVPGSYTAMQLFYQQMAQMHMCESFKY